MNIYKLFLKILRKTELSNSGNIKACISVKKTILKDRHDLNTYSY